MAKQAGPFFIRGCYGNICFYYLSGSYYARMKSSLNGKRVKTDPAFIETMHHARLLGHGSRLASILYRAIPKEEKKHSLYRKLTGQAMLLLKEGKTDSEILEKLRYTI